MKREKEILTAEGEISEMSPVTTVEKMALYSPLSVGFTLHAFVMRASIVHALRVAICGPLLSDNDAERPKNKAVLASHMLSVPPSDR